MENNNKKGLANLTKKAAAVFGAALAALTSVNAQASDSQFDNIESKTIQVNEAGKKKPMPVLKLNVENPDDSQFVASHSSHSSHRSHSSHSSHYSHRSGAMFS